MRIVSFDVGAELTRPLGLQPARMERLGRDVVIAGPNGAGKTRLLDLIQAAIAKKAVPMVTTATIAGYESRLISDRNNESAYQNALDRLAPSCRSIQYDRPDEQILTAPTAVAFVPPGGKLRDVRTLTSANAEINVAAVERNIGFVNSVEGTIPYLEDLWLRYRDATHQVQIRPAEELAEVIAKFQRMQIILQSVLGVKLTSDVRRHAMLFDKPIGDAQLSDGQLILLQFCVALHAQGDRLKECILFLDEPEKHLHPAALVDTIRRLQELVSDGQIFIATHSVHVLAHVDPASIWYMIDGKVEYAGRNPELVLQGLLGDDEQVSRLHTFLGEPARLAVTSFALQCLLPPTTVATTADRQSTQMKNILLADFGKVAKCVVDYGAGRGRLLAALAEGYSPGADDLPFADALDYLAVDPGDEDKAECENAIAKVFGAGDGRRFADVGAVRTTKGDHFADVVVLCNVLHEVDPRDWPQLLNPASGIGALLKPNGVVLIVEDQRMPVGEKAHPKGFLVLDTVALRSLFGATPAQISRSAADDDGRLLAHVVPASMLARVTEGTIRKAIEEVAGAAQTEIRKLRHGDAGSATYKHGLRHAFWTHQFANAQLALAEMGPAKADTVARNARAAKAPK